MNIQRIKYFVALCETLHFTETATKLKISQPALTKSIQQLEDELGMQLIRREGKHTHLTRNGQQAYRRFKSLLEHVSVIESELSSLSKHKPSRIVIAVSVNLDFAHLAKFIKFYHDQYPFVSIDIVDCAVGKGIEGLENGLFDCLLTIDKSVKKLDLNCINLFDHSHATLHRREHKTYTASNDKNSLIHDDDGYFGLLESGSRSQNIRCSQLLWTQELVKVGIGSAATATGNNVLSGVAASEDNRSSTIETVIAAMPMGRSDNRALYLLQTALRAFEWRSSSQREDLVEA